jgi:hypothetical protein
VQCSAGQEGGILLKSFSIPGGGSLFFFNGQRGLVLVELGAAW